MKKTSEMAPTNDVFAGSAPPPLWEDVRSKLTPKVRKSRAPVIIVFGLLAGAAAFVGWQFYGEQLGLKSGTGGALDGSVVAVVPPTIVLPPQPVVAPSPPPVAAPTPSAKPAVKPPLPPTPIVHAPSPKPEATPDVAVAAGGCPAGTTPIGKKVCIDQFEFPGGKAVPRTQVSFVEAAQLCGGRGERLCTEGEWERACRGPRGSDYPYGAAYVAGKCNTKGGSGKLLPGGSVATCRSPSGAFDLSGNAAEWVIVEAQQIPAIKGGSALSGDPDASCARKIETTSLVGGPMVGFRCCKDAAK